MLNFNLRSMEKGFIWFMPIPIFGLYASISNLIGDYNPHNPTNITANVSVNATETFREPSNKITFDYIGLSSSLILLFTLITLTFYYSRNRNNTPDGESTRLLSQHSIVNVGEKKVEQSNLQSNINKAYDAFDQ